MEYKSPGDKMNVDTYYKVLGYACFYKANGSGVDSIKEDDITISFVREECPRDLLRYFRESGFAVEKKYPGIYYVTRKGSFPMQVIVSGELDKESHVWLVSLTKSLDFSEAETLVYQIGKLEEKEDQINASAVLNLAMEANQKVFEKVKGEDPMFEELQKLMKPHTDKIVQEAVRESKVADIEGMILKLGVSLEKACDAVGMTVEEFKRVKENRKKKEEDSVKREDEKNTAE